RSANEGGESPLPCTLYGGRGLSTRLSGDRGHRYSVGSRPPTGSPARATSGGSPCSAPLAQFDAVRACRGLVDRGEASQAGARQPGAPTVPGAIAPRPSTVKAVDCGPAPPSAAEPSRPAPKRVVCPTPAGAAARP